LRFYDNAVMDRQSPIHENEFPPILVTPPRRSRAFTERRVERGAARRAREAA